MSTPNPVPTPSGSLLLELLKADVIATEGPFVLTFLQNFLSAKTALGRTAALIQLNGDLTGGLIKVDASIAGQVQGALSTKLEASIAAAQAEITAAAPAAAAIKPA